MTIVVIRRTAVMLVLLATTTIGHAQPQPRSPIVSTIDVQILTAPALVTIAGQRHVVYELHVTNVRSSEVTVTGVDVEDADRRTRLGVASDPGERRTLPPGQRTVLYVWLPIDAGTPPPVRVRHRVMVEIPNQSPSATEVETEPVAVREDRPIVLGPPLKGGPWVALYDPHLVGGHRTAIYALGGRARIPARFAIDWVKLAADGTRARGDTSVIANWYGYGADVLAVVDGVIADTKDDLAEAPTLPAPGTRERVPLENVSGNFVCLDVGGGRFAFYEHLKHGSIRVKPGDHVRRGQTIAALGNSGGSTAGPHLHFHVADHRDELAAEGLPYTIDRFTIVGTYPDIGAFTKNQPWNPPPTSLAGPRREELPAPNIVVQFPD